MCKKPEITFPYVLTSKFGSVKVYECVNRAKWKTYTLCWRGDGRRKRVNVSNLDEALLRADELLNDIKQCRLERSDTSSARFMYFRECERRLNGVPLMEAVEFYLSHFGEQGSPSTVADVVDKFLATQRARVAEGTQDADQYSRHMETLESHLNRFKARIIKPIRAVTPSELDEYLSGVGSSGRTRFNHRRTLISLWNWAKDHRYVGADTRTVAQRSATPKVVREDPGIFKPEDMAKLLAGAEARLLPYLAIGAFAGLRSAELCRLEWSNILWDDNIIVLRRGVTKGQRRRTATIRPNLMELLLPFKGKTGKILDFCRPHSLIDALCKQVGVEWVNNGLRHSCISYAMALERNAAAVAEQCGNSESEIQRSYKALVTENDAKRWFSIASL